MNRPMDDDTLDLLGAYALGAVDDDERARVEALLERSPAARAELARYEHALAGLSDAEATVPPPAGSWDRLRAAMHDTAADTAPTAADPSDAAGTAPAAMTPTSTPTGAASTDPGPGAHPPLRPPVREPEGAAGVVVPLRPRRVRLGVLLAAAAVVVAGVLGGVVISRNGGSAADRAAARAWDAAGSVRGTVASPDGAVGLRAVVTSGGDGYLYAGDLPRLPAGRTYQLWSLDGDAPVSLGVLGNRPGLVMFSTSDQVRALAVSVEQSPGASSPTLPPVAAGTLA